MKANKKGLTLVELIVVMALVATLAAIILPNITTYLTRSKFAQANENAKIVYTAVNAELTEMYFDDVDFPRYGEAVVTDTGSCNFNSKGRSATTMTIDISEYLDGYKGTAIVKLNSSGTSVDHVTWSLGNYVQMGKNWPSKADQKANATNAFANGNPIGSYPFNTYDKKEAYVYPEAEPATPAGGSGGSAKPTPKPKPTPSTPEEEEKGKGKLPTETTPDPDPVNPKEQNRRSREEKADNGENDAYYGCDEDADDIAEDVVKKIYDWYVSDIEEDTDPVMDKKDDEGDTWYEDSWHEYDYEGDDDDDDERTKVEKYIKVDSKYSDNVAVVFPKEKDGRLVIVAMIGGEDDDDDDYYLNLDPKDLQNRVDGVKKVFDERKSKTGENAIVGYEGNYVYYVVDTKTNAKDVNTHVSDIIKDEIEDEEEKSGTNINQSLNKDDDDDDEKSESNKNKGKGNKGKGNKGKGQNNKKNHKK